MSTRIFDRVRQLHIDTLDPDNSTHRDRGLRALSTRLYRSDQYGKKLSCGNRSDVTAIVLIVAYVKGYTAVSKRKESKFASMDLTLLYDEKFYNGIWDIMCDLYAPESAIIKPLPPLPIDNVRSYIQDPDIRQFNIQTFCDDYLQYCILNDGPCESRNAASAMLNLPRTWVSLHYLLNRNKPRLVPIEKLIRMVFGLFRLDYLMRPAPTPTYWNNHAHVTWKYLHWRLRTELDKAEAQWIKSAQGDTGIDTTRSRDHKKT